MIVPDREKCPKAGRHFEETVSEGSFGAGRLKEDVSRLSRNPALKERDI